jgi:hypothetical protein
MEEVERFEGVGRGVMGLLRLWKCVEKSKVPRLQNQQGWTTQKLLSDLRVNHPQRAT